MIACTPLTPAFHAQVFALGAQLFRAEDIPEIGNALAFACAPSAVLLAPDGHVAGFALFCKGQCLSTKSSPRHSTYKGNLKNKVELPFFAIDPSYQGAGLGSKLLAHCLGQLPPEAACWLVTEVENTVAPRLYRKYGFECVHTIAEAHPYPLHLWIRCADANTNIAKFDATFSQHTYPSPLIHLSSKCLPSVALSSIMTT